MKISSAEFVKSAFEPAHWTVDGLPEVAFLGRSNVGKSSLINALLNRRGLARTSNTPGRTQAINFFLVNGTFYFVDLPGYGYAKVSKTMRQDWGKMAEEYLSEREELALCIQLVDSRHEPTTLDRQLNEWLCHYGKPHIVAATKSDKLSANQLFKQRKVIEKAFQFSRVVPVSTESDKGLDDIRGEIFAAVKKATT